MAELDYRIVQQAGQNNFGNSLAGAVQGGIQQYQQGIQNQQRQQVLDQQAAIAPLQQQALQQQVKTGSLEQQQKQLELIGQHIRLATPDNYQQVLKSAFDNGLDISMMSPTYNKQQLDTMAEALMPAAQRLQMQVIAETNRHNLAMELKPSAGQGAPSGYQFTSPGVLAPIPGGPADKPQPTNSTGNPALDKAMAGKDATSLKAFEDSSAAATDLADKANQFLAFRKNMNFGGPIAGRLPNFSDAAANADQLTTDMSLAKTQLMKGAQSDKELQSALNSVPNGKMTISAAELSNKKIQAATSIAQAKQSFMEQYVQANGGLRGAETSWLNFRKANPFLDNGNVRNDVAQKYDPAQDFSSYIKGAPKPANAAVTKTIGNATYEQDPATGKWYAQ